MQRITVAVIWLALMTTWPLRRTIATHFPPLSKSGDRKLLPSWEFRTWRKTGGERGIHFDNEANSSALRHFAGQTTDRVELTLFVAFRSFLGLFATPEAFAIVATHECDAQASGPCY